MKHISLFILLLFFAVEVYAQNIPNYIPANGLVGWWPFNGNANDESGNGNNGTVNGATLTSDRFGYPNAAYIFDGVDDFISTNYMPPTGSNSRSISTWFKWSLIDINDHAILSYGGNTASCTQAGGNFEIGIFTPSSPFFRIDAVCSANFSIDTIDNSWHNGIVVYDESLGTTISTIKLYVDGQLLSTNDYIGNTQLNTLLINNLIIGKSCSTGSRFFNGIIDDIAIYNRALTQQEISNLYNSGCSAQIQQADTVICPGDQLSLTAIRTQTTMTNSVVGYLPNSSVNIQDTTTWHYIALTKSSQNGSFYLDGNLITNSSFSNVPYIWNSLLLGATQACVSCAPVADFNGFIDEVRVSNIARTASSIANTFIANATFPQDANTIGLFHLDNLSGNTVLNSVGGSAAAFGSPIISGGKFGQSLKFDGLDDYVRWTNSIPVNNMTVEFWFKSADLSATMAMLEYAYNTGIYLQNSQVLTPISWSTGDTSSTIIVSPTQNTTYTLTATENGITCTDNITITVTYPTANITTAGSTTLCQGGSVVLNANTGAGLTYQWQYNGNNIAGATAANYTANSAGSYTVVVTNNNGCSATSSPTVVTITQTANPTVSANGPITFCNGGSVTLNSSAGSSYLWSNGATSQSITVNQSGTYSVTTNTNGCSGSSAPITVTVNQLPLAAISSSGPTTFCQGSSVALNANTGAGLTYQWQLYGNNIAGATAASYTANAAGSYTVVVTNSNGCSATSSATTVTVSTSPTVSITPSGPTTFCAGGSVTLSASGASTYQWSNGSNSSFITVSQSGNYTVTGFSNGCSGNASPVGITVFNNPSVSAGGLPPYTNVNASPLALTANPSGGVFSGFGVNGNQFNPSQAGLGTATVFYSYTDGNGCSNSTFQQTIVYDTLSQACSTFDTLYINTVITGAIAPNNTSTITIYPNPANTDLVIHNGNFGIMGAYSVRITNTLGQTVFLSQVNQQQFVIALSTLGGAGTYYFALLDGQGNVVETKVIVVQ